MIDLLTIVVGILAGAIASVSGFGIGSLLTPLMAMSMGLHTAVAAVSVPHALGTICRFLMIRKDLDKQVFVSFGIPSAIGGLTGALLHGQSGHMVLFTVFALLLVFVGICGLTGISERMKIPKGLSSPSGFASGLLGGLVGNQGGIRSAALLGLDLSKSSYVATATAVALLVDVARLPVYLIHCHDDLPQFWRSITIATVAVLIGTFTGKLLLEKIPDCIFKRSVAALILGLGIWMFIKGA